MVSAGTLAIPEFQRNFVWKPDQVIELLESVARGWPIGSLLLLEGPQPFRVKQIAGGPEVDRKYVRLHVLDGQQRITALFHALTDTGSVVYFVDTSEQSEFEEYPSIRWADRDNFSPTDSKFTIRELVNKSLLDRRLTTVSGEDARRVKLIGERVVGFLSGGYEFSTILMQNDIDLEALTRIFETLNRTGEQLNAFDLMVALLYPHNFNLRARWDECLESEELFRKYKTSGTEILKLIALVEWASLREEGRPVGPRAVMGVRQRDVLSLKPETVVEEWDDAILDYRKALEFFELRCGVRQGNLPSEAMVLTAAFLLRKQNSPETVQRWYWRSILAQAYAQGANTRILTDAAHNGDVPSIEDAVDVLSAALKEPIRRSRILRLGLRGAAVLGQAEDPTSGTVLSQAAGDVPFSTLITGVKVPAAAVRVGDLVVVDKPFARSRFVPMKGTSLTTQGFPDGSEMEVSMEIRARKVMEWIGEWL
ncbi:DUF262 domain-containing protein [Curtobacterium sp. AB451]|uniref:DUF262 domain-containing protein n=1 Tax=Curtobacterium sp. AB451 TaxID=3422306 RepID=UPI003D3479B0